MIVRILLLILITIIMLSIFSLIMWRFGAILWFNLNLKKSIFAGFILLLIFIFAMFLISSSFKYVEIIGSIILYIIYAIRVISPLIFIIDIVWLWYKAPLVFIIPSIIIRLGFGIYSGTQPQITPLNISDSRLSQDYKVAFISDMHVNILQYSWYVQSIVRHIQDLKVDFVIIAWDLMNVAKIDYVDAFLPFNQLDIPVFATLWNHDNMWNKSAIDILFQKTQIIPLRNQTIDLESLQIVWIDDPSYRSGKDLSTIISQTQLNDQSKFTIFVTHQPIHLSKLSAYPIDLQLAWHTHNGQFIPLSRIIGLFNDYSYGLYHYWDQKAFVSQWIGARGAPIRIWTRSEIVLISLKKI